MGNKLPLYQPGSPWIANLAKGYFSSIGMLTSGLNRKLHSCSDPLIVVSTKARWLKLDGCRTETGAGWMRPLRPLELFSDLLAPSPPIQVNKCKQDCLLLSGLRTRRIYYVKSFENIAQIQLIASLFCHLSNCNPKKCVDMTKNFSFQKLFSFSLAISDVVSNAKSKGRSFTFVVGRIFVFIAAWLELDCLKFKRFFHLPVNRIWTF